MSPSPPARRQVPRHRAADYWKVASHLMESARTLLTLGDREYGNAIGICIIHAVISANDAVTIQRGGVRSSGDQHMEAERLLRELVRDVPREITQAFAAVVRAKFEYEYSGDVFTPATAKRLQVKAERFYQWAKAQTSPE